jgi:predicted metal-dependent enzyme (double-stranded beta helix superfamily)
MHPLTSVWVAANANAMKPSGLLAIARGLTHDIQDWHGMRESTKRVWRLLASSEAFEAWVIGWPVGGAIELHDHGGSTGVIVVARGELVEIAVKGNHHGVLKARRSTLPTSASIAFDVTHVHEIVNMGPDPAMSVHVYAPPLKTMTYYDFNDGFLEVKTSTRFEAGKLAP